MKSGKEREISDKESEEVKRDFSGQIGERKVEWTDDCKAKATCERRKKRREKLKINDMAIRNEQK